MTNTPTLTALAEAYLSATARTREALAVVHSARGGQRKLHDAEIDEIFAARAFFAAWQAAQGKDTTDG